MGRVPATASRRSAGFARFRSTARSSPPTRRTSVSPRTISDPAGSDSNWTIRCSRCWKILVGFDTGQADTRGSYLDLVYADGSEIEHSALLSITEYTIGARIRPLRERRASPYLVLGLSRASYEYSELGQFVDFETSDIFHDEFGERQSLTGFFAGAGLDFALVWMPFERRMDAFGEFRYHRNQGRHVDDFSEFGDLTVARTGVLLGFRVRF